MWLFYALLGPPFWALVHVLDSHCVGNVFDRPWMGVITSSLATAVLALLVLPFSPYLDWQLPAWHLIGIALLAGMLIQIAQGFYFHALERTEAGIVAAYGNFTPALLTLVSYFLLGEALQTWHYVSIAVLVVVSICLCLIDAARNSSVCSFWLMLFASVAQIGAILLEKYVFMHSSFAIGFMLIILSGVLPLLFVSRVRNAFCNNLQKLKPLTLLFLGIEFANVLALFLSQRAIDLGSPSLTSAMEATVPGYTFLISILLLLCKHRFGNEASRYQMRTKFFLVSIMTGGVVMMT